MWLSVGTCDRSTSKQGTAPAARTVHHGANSLAGCSITRRRHERLVR